MKFFISSSGAAVLTEISDEYSAFVFITFDIGIGYRIGIRDANDPEAQGPTRKSDSRELKKALETAKIPAVIFSLKRAIKWESENNDKQAVVIPVVSLERLKEILTELSPWVPAFQFNCN